jgi:hypothetical protein
MTIDRLSDLLLSTLTTTKSQKVKRPEEDRTVEELWNRL